MSEDLKSFFCSPDFAQFAALVLGIGIIGGIIGGLVSRLIDRRINRAAMRSRKPKFLYK